MAERRGTEKRGAADSIVSRAAPESIQLVDMRSKLEDTNVIMQRVKQQVRHGRQTVRRWQAKCSVVIRWWIGPLRATNSSERKRVAGFTPAMALRDRVLAR